MNQQEVLRSESNPLKRRHRKRARGSQERKHVRPTCLERRLPHECSTAKPSGRPMRPEARIPGGPVSFRAVLGHLERGDALPSTCPETPGLPGASPLPPRGLLAGRPHLLRGSGMYLPPLPQQRGRHGLTGAFLSWRLKITVHLQTVSTAPRGQGPPRPGQHEQCPSARGGTAMRSPPHL